LHQSLLKLWMPFLRPHAYDRMRVQPIYDTFDAMDDRHTHGRVSLTSSLQHICMPAVDAHRASSTPHFVWHAASFIESIPSTLNLCRPSYPTVRYPIRSHRSIRTRASHLAPIMSLIILPRTWILHGPFIALFHSWDPKLS